MFAQTGFVIASESLERGCADAVKISAAKIDVLILHSRFPVIGDRVFKARAYDHGTPAIRRRGRFRGRLATPPASAAARLNRFSDPSRHAKSCRGQA